MRRRLLAGIQRPKMLGRLTQRCRQRRLMWTSLVVGWSVGLGLVGGGSGCSGPPQQPASEMADGRSGEGDPVVEAAIAENPSHRADPPHAGDDDPAGAGRDQSPSQHLGSASEDWLFFRGDGTGQAFIRESRLPASLELLWEFWEPKTSYESSPVVADGKVVVADLDGNIRCLDLQDKRLLWKTETKFGFVASPSIRDGKIFIGDMDGLFRCLDLSSGSVVWEFQANAQIDSTANFHAEHVLFGSYDSHLYCLNRQDGGLVWKHQTDDQIRCSIAIAGDRTAVAGCDAMLHVIDLMSGEGRTKVELSSQTASTPCLVGPRAYFGMENGEFVCADMDERKLIWTWKDEKREAPIRGSAAVTDDRVVFGTRGSRVNCLDRATGELKWQLNAERSVEGSALVVGDRVYIGDSAGNLLVISLDSGELLQKLELSGGIPGSPCLVGDRLLVATQEGIVYCLGRGTQ